jgi:hypothetical protein
VEALVVEGRRLLIPTLTFSGPVTGRRPAAPAPAVPSATTTPTSAIAQATTRAEIEAASMRRSA